MLFNSTVIVKDVNQAPVISNSAINKKKIKVKESVIVDVEAYDPEGEELTYFRLASIHNLNFILRLMENIRNSIKENNFKEGKMALSKELLDILACPKCKGDIHLNDTQDGLICEKCKLVYEIRDDIPIMLIDEAKPLEA